MSFWTDIRHPLFMGAGVGLGYDYFTDQGVFEPNSSSFGVDWKGAPQYPMYRDAYDPFAMSVSGINPDQRGMDQYRREALREGPSTWASLATAKAEGDEARAKNALRGEADSSAATARGQLAMRGGMTSGARERIAMNSARDLTEGSQKLAAEGMGNKLQIGINDERNRVAQLGQLPGMDLAQAQFQVGKKGMDVKNALDENLRKNAFTMAKYQADAQKWGAAQQANATAYQANQSSGGMSWICTESKKLATKTPEWSKKDQKALDKFKRYALKRHAEGARFYLYHCGKLIEKMHAKGGANWRQVYNFVQLIIFYVERDSMEKAFVAFVRYVRDLIDQYWPECENPVYLSITKNKGAA